MLHISPGITIYILTITFILGCCLGSFADCAAGRLLSGESVVAGRSHCDHCGHVLGVDPAVFLAPFKRTLPLLQGKDTGGSLFCGTGIGNCLLYDRVSL